MQRDMHFYSTYAIARLAGFEKGDANVIATAAQYVDDSTDKNSQKNENGEMLLSVVTAHHVKDVPLKSLFHPKEHRLVWVPFHFYPGGEGDSFEEKLLCTKNSVIVNEMFTNHLELENKDFYLHLLGIAAHVYMDTFSHYGFSGICSDLNKVDEKTIELEVEDIEMREYIEKKAQKLFKKHQKEVNSFMNKSNSAISRIIDVVNYVMMKGAEKGSKGLGHGAVATYPDRPYLRWNFEYETPRYGGQIRSGERNNPQTFLEGLVKLHEKLSQAAENKYQNPSTQKLAENTLKDILALEANGSGREQKWKEYIKQNLDDGLEIDYLGDDWENEKDKFHESAKVHVGNCYKFHQAAAYHRWFTLKDLLPKHGIYVF